MTCKICKISNQKVIDAIEQALYESRGILAKSKLDEIAEMFPEFADEVRTIDDQSIYLHYNFHMHIARMPKIAQNNVPENGAGADRCSISSPQKSSSRLVDEIRYDEAEILYEVLNMQAATFSALSNKINEALTVNEEDKTFFIHPETRQFYSELGSSIRATVKEIRETHKAINGEKDGAVEGLKAIAAAIHGVVNDSEKEDDMTTKMFDD